MNKFAQISAFAVFTISLAACAGSASSSMNPGERLSERGGEITRYGDEWAAGNKAVREGEKLAGKSANRIADARKTLAEAEEDRVRAQRMITDGTSMMQRSEADYAAARAGPPVIAAPQPR